MEKSSSFWSPAFQFYSSNCHLLTPPYYYYNKIFPLLNFFVYAGLNKNTAVRVKSAGA